MKKINFIVGGLVLLVFTACGNGGGSEPPAPPVTRTAVQVASAKIVGNVTTPAGVSTRVGDASWDAGDAIGLVLLQAGSSTPIDGKAALNYTTATAQAAFKAIDEANTAYYPLEGKLADVLAFYPYSKIGPDLLVPVTTADQSVLSRIDFMVANKSVGHGEAKPNVELTFSHKLAKVVVVVSKDASASSIDLAGAKLKLSGTAVAAKWSLIDGRLTEQGADTDIKMVTAGDKDKVNATGIALPTTAGKTATLTLTTASNRVFVLDEGTLALAAGQQHTLTLVLTRNAMVVDSFVIVPWADVVGDGGLGW